MHAREVINKKKHDSDVISKLVSNKNQNMKIRDNSVQPKTNCKYLLI